MGPLEIPLLGLYFGASQQHKAIKMKTDISRDEAHPARCHLLSSYNIAAPQPARPCMASPRLASRANLILLLPRMQRQQPGACTRRERAWRRSGACLPACLPGCFFSSVCLCNRSSAARCYLQLNSWDTGASRRPCERGGNTYFLALSLSLLPLFSLLRSLSIRCLWDYDADTAASTASRQVKSLRRSC